MGRKVGKKASERMKNLRASHPNSYFQCFYLNKRKRKEIINWKKNKK